VQRNVRLDGIPEMAGYAVANPPYGPHAALASIMAAILAIFGPHLSSVA